MQARLPSRHDGLLRRACGEPLPGQAGPLSSLLLGRSCKMHYQQKALGNRTLGKVLPQDVPERNLRLVGHSAEKPVFPWNLPVFARCLTVGSSYSPAELTLGYAPSHHGKVGDLKLSLSLKLLHEDHEALGANCPCHSLGFSWALARLGCFLQDASGHHCSHCPVPEGLVPAAIV